MIPRSILLGGTPEGVFVDTDAVREALAQIPSVEYDNSLFIAIEAVNAVLEEFTETAVTLSPSLMDTLGVEFIAQSVLHATRVGRVYIDTSVIYELLQDNDCILGPDDGLTDAAVLDRELNNLDQEIII